MVLAGIERSPKIFDFRASGIPVQKRVDFFDTLKRQGTAVFLHNIFSVIYHFVIYFCNILSPPYIFGGILPPLIRFLNGILFSGASFFGNYSAAAFLDALLSVPFSDRYHRYHDGDGDHRCSYRYYRICGRYPEAVFSVNDAVGRRWCTAGYAAAY